MKQFNRCDYFPYKNKINTKSIENLLEEEIIFSQIFNNFEILEISSLKTLRNNSIIFLEKELEIEKINSMPIHVISDINNNKNYYKNITIVNNLSFAYNSILNHLFYHDDHLGFSDDFDFIDGSYISKYCEIGSKVEIGKNCVISRGVKIGKNSIIKNNVVIKNTIIGDNVVVSDNTSVGTSGFGFDFKKRGSLSLNPHIGIVIIEDNVHLGASCTVDRGKIDTTFVGKNSMIDNMVHIGHNVIIGKNACIAAQTGISGSVTIDDNVTIGGQAGLAGHIFIGKNVIIAARSGVTKNIKDNSVVAGFPAIDIKDWKKSVIRQRKHGH